MLYNIIPSCTYFENFYKVVNLIKTKLTFDKIVKIERQR